MNQFLFQQNNMNFMTPRNDLDSTFIKGKFNFQPPQEEIKDHFEKLLEMYKQKENESVVIEEITECKSEL